MASILTERVSAAIGLTQEEEGFLKESGGAWQKLVTYLNDCLPGPEVAALKAQHEAETVNCGMCCWPADTDVHVICDRVVV